MATLVDGTHTFKVRAIDNVGNWGNAASVQVRIDTTAPSLAADNDGTDTDKCRLTMDGSNWYFNTSTWFNAVALKARVYAKDSNPNGSIAADCSGLSAGVGDVQYQYSTNSGSSYSGWTNCENLELGYDGSQDAWKYAKAENLTFVEGNVNRLQFRVKDKAGNTTTQTYTVYIDLSAEANWTNFQVAGGLPSVWYTSSTTVSSLTIQNQDSLSGFGSAEYQISTNGGSSWGSLVSASGPTVGTTTLFTITANNVAFGQNSAKVSNGGVSQTQIRWKFTDQAGNSVTSGAYEVLIDTSNPTVVGESPLVGWIASQTITPYCAFQDLDSGIDIDNLFWCWSDDGSTFKDRGGATVGSITDPTAVTAWSKCFPATDSGGATRAADGDMIIYAFPGDTDDVATNAKSSITFGQTEDSSNNVVHVKFAAKDVAGNGWTIENVAFGIDVVNPGIAGLSAYTDSLKGTAFGSSWRNDNDPYFEWTGNDAGSGIDGFSIHVVQPGQANVEPDTVKDQEETDTNWDIASEGVPANP